MKPQNLFTQPYKGARDFYPEEMRIRNYIFDTWKKVCTQYGYEEYDGPFLESFDIYAAKSGEELVNEQLYSFVDRGKRKVAIRPEMTPTVARMVSQKYKSLVFPTRWFSVANFWRYEKPQKGRLREFFQINIDIFGVSGIEADFELISILVDIPRAFGAKESMFEVRFGNRKFMEDIFTKFGISKEQATKTLKAIDKKTKISDNEFKELLKEYAKLSQKQSDSLCQFLEDPMLLVEETKESAGAQEVTSLLKLLRASNLDKYVKFTPTVVRGLDYYTGTVYELYDLNPQNPRSLAGGGRYDNLTEAFINEKIPATGFAMGDVTFKNFLENWNLLPSFKSVCEYLVTTWPEKDQKYLRASLETAKILREKGKNTVVWLETDTKLEKQLKYADKTNVNYAIIIGERELTEKSITIKDLKTQRQETKTLEKFLAELS